VPEVRCRLPPAKGTGRRPSYCGVGCRRAAEFEIRRTQHAVEAVEANLRMHREHAAMRPELWLDCCGRGEALQRRIVWLQGERERLEARMRQLLGGADG
jgi:hypothetical protein